MVAAYDDDWAGLLYSRWKKDLHVAAANMKNRFYRRD
jgi:hypothetical protein